MHHVYSSGVVEYIQPSDSSRLRLFFQSTLLLGDSKKGLSKSGGRGRPEIKSHKELESHLAHYSGLILYVKEMDELTYGKLCAVRVP